MSAEPDYQAYQPAPEHPDGDALFDAAAHRGARLAGIVRDGSAGDVAAVTDDLDRDELVATVVALACMVPVDRTVPELLDWFRPVRLPRRRPRLSTVCGTCGALTFPAAACDVCQLIAREGGRDRAG